MLKSFTRQSYDAAIFGHRSNRIRAANQQCRIFVLTGLSTPARHVIERELLINPEIANSLALLPVIRRSPLKHPAQPVFRTSASPTCHGVELACRAAVKKLGILQKMPGLTKHDSSVAVLPGIPVQRILPWGKMRS